MTGHIPYLNTEYAQTKMIEEYNREAKMEHTPGPWTVHKDEMGRGYEILGNAPSPGWGSLGHKEICRINSRRTGAKRGMSPSYYEHPDDAANADYIVRACNCHDELLAACKRAFSFLHVDVPLGTVNDHELMQCQIELQNAIAKAEEDYNTKGRAARAVAEGHCTQANPDERPDNIPGTAPVTKGRREV